MSDLIGFIGVGTMGEPMCRNLAKKSGLKVLAADRDPAPLKRLEGDGIFGTPALTQAWAKAVLHHPLAYLQHRAAFMTNFLTA